MKIVKFPKKNRRSPKRRGIYRNNVLKFKALVPTIVYCPGCGQQVFTDEDKSIALKTWRLLDQIQKNKEAEL